MMTVKIMLPLRTQSKLTELNHPGFDGTGVFCSVIYLFYMLIISGEYLAAMIPGHTYTVVANSAMKGNEALLFCQKLNVSWPVAKLLADADVRDQVFRELRIAIPEQAPSV
jgi:uncharacterized protein YjaG (DUF416 family)